MQTYIHWLTSNKPDEPIAEWIIHPLKSGPGVFLLGGLIITWAGVLAKIKKPDWSL